jgi:hypothetical protein
MSVRDFILGAVCLGIPLVVLLLCRPRGGRHR